MPAGTDRGDAPRSGTTNGATTFEAFLKLPDAVARIPEELPERPAFETAAVSYLPLDGEVVPTLFVRDVLRDIAGELLAAVDAAIVLAEPVANGARVVDASPSLPLPSIVLDLTFTDTGETLQVPAHGLVWVATQSPKFEPILSLLDLPPLDYDREGRHLVLPTHAVRVPSFSAWQPLHDFIHDRSTAHLLEYLLHASRERRSSSSGVTPLANSSSTAAERERHERETLEKLDRIRGLWLNAVALQIGDDDLWATMALAWDSLYDQARRNTPIRSSPES
ncbi:hypothetical protein JCM10908_003249 [Rhodotorula pacifica]|uniref:uncharacterized protein n=1 Tax=Rhodotorula pacifica TaxID=1495444 RepID=UPI00316C082C